MSAPAHDDRPMTLGEHLEELRWRVLKALGWVALAAIVSLYFQDGIMRLALWPHRRMAADARDQARTREARERLDGRLVTAAQTAVDEDDALQRAREGLDRARAIAREKARPSLDELERLRARQDDLRGRVDALRGRFQAAAAEAVPDAARLADLERQRDALDAEAEALRRDADRVARPLLDARAKGPSAQIRSQRPQDMFMAYLKLALLAGLFGASPLIVRELWGFVAAGLYAHEKRYVNLFGPLSFLAFVAGFLFGYLVMIPFGLSFLASYGPADMFDVEYTVEGYLSTFIGLSLVSGAIFELPLIMTFLTLIGVMSPAKYRAFRRYWVLVAFIIAAILTPPDGVTQILMAIPLLGLYELGIVLSAVVRPDEPAGDADADAGAAAPAALTTAAAVDPYPETAAAVDPYPETPVGADPYPETPLAPPAAAPALDPLAPRPPPEGTVALAAEPHALTAAPEPGPGPTSDPSPPRHAPPP